MSAVGPPEPVTPVVWGNVPPRNPNFTGRQDQLDRLTNELSVATDPLVLHALEGMGGVGKTQLAIEYIYRHTSSYEVVWWITADQPALVRSSLDALARELGLETSGVADSMPLVLEALRQGRPHARWLLVFDNAGDYDAIRELVPFGTGHVLVTSRNQQWRDVAKAVEVDVFTRDESLRFLRSRVPGMSEGRGRPHRRAARRSPLGA